MKLKDITKDHPDLFEKVKEYCLINNSDIDQIASGYTDVSYSFSYFRIVKKSKKLTMMKELMKINILAKSMILLRIQLKKGSW